MFTWIKYITIVIWFAQKHFTTVYWKLQNVRPVDFFIEFLKITFQCPFLMYLQLENIQIWWTILSLLKGHNIFRLLINLYNFWKHSNKIPDKTGSILLGICLLSNYPRVNMKLIYQVIQLTKSIKYHISLYICILISVKLL